LILDLVTPLDEVLAVVTELGPLVDAPGVLVELAPPGLGAPVLGVEPTALRGDEAGRDPTA
jgi:hypothetical protein